MNLCNIRISQVNEKYLKRQVTNAFVSQRYSPCTQTFYDPFPDFSKILSL